MKETSHFLAMIDECEHTLQDENTSLELFYRNEPAAVDWVLNQIHGKLLTPTRPPAHVASLDNLLELLLKKNKKQKQQPLSTVKQVSAH